MLVATPSLIETWLFEQGGWVSCDHICTRWDVSDRRLRHLGEGFLVSRNVGGYIHYLNCTPKEFEAWRGPLRSHYFSERKKVNLISKRRREGRLPESHAPVATIQTGLAL